MNPVSVKGLGRTYGKAVALAKFDLQVKAGECVALLGHNGSGKTTALTSIAGLRPPSSGEVRILGADPFVEPDATKARKAMAYVSDSPVFYDDMTVAEHVELTGLGHGVAERMGSDAFDARCEKLLAQMGLANHRDHVPEELSAGLQQRTQLACAFIRPFKVLLLDEPVLRLDPAAQQLLAKRLTHYRERGVAIIVSTHSPTFARELADRVVLLAGGKVAARGTFDQIATTKAAQELGLS